MSPITNLNLIVRENLEPRLQVILAPWKAVNEEPLGATVKDSLFQKSNHDRGWYQ